MKNVLMHGSMMAAPSPFWARVQRDIVEQRVDERGMSIARLREAKRILREAGL